MYSPQRLYHPHLQTLFNLKDTQIFSIPSGILPPDTLPPRDSARKHLAETFGSPPDTRFVGFVGRLSKDKGVTTLVQAFKQVFQHIPHHLVLVGNGPDVYQKRLEKMTQDLEIYSRTHFMGFTDDVWPVYRALDCKVLASENINGIPFEGIPQALLEAMYCDCPVIGSKPAASRISFGMAIPDCCSIPGMPTPWHNRSGRPCTGKPTPGNG